MLDSLHDYGLCALSFTPDRSLTNLRVVQKIRRDTVFSIQEAVKM
jgi:hypothetical protein